jgi:hypothetical protein
MYDPYGIFAARAKLGLQSISFGREPFISSTSRTNAASRMR